MEIFTLISIRLQVEFYFFGLFQKRITVNTRNFNQMRNILVFYLD